MSGSVGYPTFSLLYLAKRSFVSVSPEIDNEGILVGVRSTGLEIAGYMTQRNTINTAAMYSSGNNIIRLSLLFIFFYEQPKSDICG